MPTQLSRRVRGKADERELVEAFRRPENRAVHDRMSERITARLAPTLGRVIAACLFRRQDPRFAAVFVIRTFTALHDVVSEPADMSVALAHLDTYILRGLGYSEHSVP